MESLKRKRRGCAVESNHKRLCAVDRFATPVCDNNEFTDSELLAKIQAILFEYDKKLTEIRHEFQQDINHAIQSTRTCYSSTYIS